MQANAAKKRTQRGLAFAWVCFSRQQVRMDAEKKDEKKETGLSNSNHSHYRSPLIQGQKFARETFTQKDGTKSSGSYRGMALKRDVNTVLSLDKINLLTDLTYYIYPSP